MFPGKADVFIRKWEATIIPKILKLTTASEPAGLPPIPENDGKMIFRHACVLEDNWFVSKGSEAFWTPPR